MTWRGCSHQAAHRHRALDSSPLLGQHGPFSLSDTTHPAFFKLAPASCRHPIPWSLVYIPATFLRERGGYYIHTYQPRLPDLCLQQVVEMEITFILLSSLVLSSVEAVQLGQQQIHLSLSPADDSGPSSLPDWIVRHAGPM
jgi:hypothetical protein